LNDHIAKYQRKKGDGNMRKKQKKIYMMIFIEIKYKLERKQSSVDKPFILFLIACVDMA
jgi:hypothetical protein